MRQSYREMVEKESSNMRTAEELNIIRKETTDALNEIMIKCDYKFKVHKAQPELV
jgi:hypothetical protein